MTGKARSMFAPCMRAWRSLPSSSSALPCWGAVPPRDDADATPWWTTTADGHAARRAAAADGYATRWTTTAGIVSDYGAGRSESHPALPDRILSGPGAGAEPA